MIIIRNRKLVQKIALVDGVYLNAVAAGLFRQLRAVYHDLHQLVYLVLREGAVLQLGANTFGMPSLGATMAFE